MQYRDKMETALQLIKKLNRLTILRDITDEPPFKAFRAMLNAMINDDTIEAEKTYHRLTRQLLLSDARRVSGNLLTDYILCHILEHENKFSADAAVGFMDAFTYSAMETDLKILLDIAKLRTGDIQQWLELPGGGRGDRITVLSTAVWGGHKIDSGDSSLPKNELPSHLTACNLLSWDYGEFELRDEYVSDPALEAIYELCLSDDSSAITDELWHFFNVYGTGDFIKSRVFISDEKQLLRPVSEDIFEKELLPFISDEQRNAVIDNAIAFMRDDDAENILICGSRDTGKTTIITSLINELPEARFIYVSGRNMCKLSELFEVLSREPLKFIVLIDDAEKCENEIWHSVNEFMPSNILVTAASENESICDAFDSVLHLVMPDLTGIAKYIYDASNHNSDIAVIRNLCMNYQIETQKPLSYKAVKDILKRLQRP